MKTFFAEHRLCHELPSGPGYFHDNNERYLSGEGVVSTAIGATEYAVDVALSGGDQALRYITGKEYQSPQGIAGRTRRDLWDLVSDVAHFHPIDATLDVVRVVGGDIEMDAINLVTGHHTTAA